MAGCWIACRISESVYDMFSNTFSNDLTVQDLVFVLREGEMQSTKLVGVKDRCAQCRVTPARESVLTSVDTLTQKRGCYLVSASDDTISHALVISSSEKARCKRECDVWEQSCARVSLGLVIWW